MKRNYFIALLLILGIVYVITGFAVNKVKHTSRLLSEIDTPPSELSVPADPSGYFILATEKAYTYNGLTVIPIQISASFTLAHAGMGPYTTLPEAMAKKEVTVTERISEDKSGQVRDESSVNTLFIENNGKDTVFVMAGEMVQGGKQDRVIAKSFLLYPQSGTVDLSVFCVEHGRWETTEAGNVAISDDSSEKAAYTFTVKNKVAANSVRKVAVEEKQQTQVWDKVAEITTVNYCASSTGTYNALDENKEFNDKQKKYEEFFADIFKTNVNVAGVAVFSGDNFIGIDAFCSPELFNKEWSTLLHAYMTDAITTPGKGDKPNDALVQEKFNEFLKFYEDNSKTAREQKCMNGERVVHCAKF